MENIFTRYLDVLSELPIPILFVIVIACGFLLVKSFIDLFILLEKRANL